MLALQMPWWLLIVCGLFLAVVIYAGWPRDDGGDEGGG